MLPPVAGIAEPSAKFEKQLKSLSKRTQKQLQLVVDELAEDGGERYSPHESSGRRDCRSVFSKSLLELAKGRHLYISEIYIDGEVLYARAQLGAQLVAVVGLSAIRCARTRRHQAREQRQSNHDAGPAAAQTPPSCQARRPSRSSCLGHLSLATGPPFAPFAGAVDEHDSKSATDNLKTLARRLSVPTSGSAGTIHQPERRRANRLQPRAIHRTASTPESSGVAVLSG